VHWILEQNPSAPDRLFDGLPFADRPLAAKIKDKSGIPAIYCALQSHFTGLKKPLAQLSKEELRVAEWESLRETLLDSLQTNNDCEHYLGGRRARVFDKKSSVEEMVLMSYPPF
jgi:hypothetical protein